MPTPLKLLAGNKFSGRHTTVIRSSVSLISLIKKYDEVTKITLGTILPYHAPQPQLRFKPTQSGWELKVIGCNASQIFFIHTKNPELVKKRIEEDWEKLNR